MVSTDNLKKMADVGERIQISDVPDTFVGKLISEEERVDTMGRNCLYINIDYNGKIFTEKLTPMHITDFTKALESLGVNDTVELQGKKVEWKAMTFRIGHPRHMPSKIL